MDRNWTCLHVIAMQARWEFILHVGFHVLDSRLVDLTIRGRCRVLMLEEILFLISILLIFFYYIACRKTVVLNCVTSFLFLCSRRALNLTTNTRTHFVVAGFELVQANSIGQKVLTFELLKVTLTRRVFPNSKFSSSCACRRHVRHHFTNEHVICSGINLVIEFIHQSSNMRVGNSVFEWPLTLVSRAETVVFFFLQRHFGMWRSKGDGDACALLNWTFFF